MKNYTINDTILYLNDVSLGYEDKIILKNINILESDVSRIDKEKTGQTIAFVGRSGRGKSTLFKALTGLLDPMSGELMIRDMSSPDHKKAKYIKEGDVGFVNQKYTLFRHKTIQQICEYALRKRKETKEEKKEIIDHYLNEWGLSEHRNKYSCELSGGQKQRTAIIEQLLTSKYFIVFDEPFSGLDVGNIESVKKSFQKIQDSHELNTIIFSTHDIRLAVELADSIYIVGFPEGVTDYSTIVKHYDLKELNLAWKPYGSEHVKLYETIYQDLLKS